MPGTSPECRVCELVPDTSALLLIVEAVDPLGEAVEALRSYCSTVRVSLLAPVLRELERLASGRGRKAAAARLALAELSKWGGSLNLVEFSDCLETDECVLRYSRGLECVEAVVLTADKKLARTLKEGGVKYVTWWRSRRRFVLEFPERAVQRRSARECLRYAEISGPPGPRPAAP